MPATSAKQAKFMRAVANSPKFSKKVGVPQSVGREFTKESKVNENKMLKKEGRGMAKADMQKMKKGGIATSLKAHAAAPASKAHGMKKGGMTAMGKVKTASKPDGVIKKGGTKGKMVKMRMGGKTC